MRGNERDQQEMVDLDPLVYQALHTGTLGDIAFYCDLVHRWITDRHPNPALSDSRPWVLELGCGAGRIALPLLEAGARVIGVDHHEGLLKLTQVELERRCAERSESEASELSGRLELICRDFTTLTPDLFPQVPQGFDLILLPYNGLYCLLTEAEQIKLIKSACQLLAPHGSLWIDGYALPDPQEYVYESEEDYTPLTVIELSARGSSNAHVYNTEDDMERALGVEELDRFTLSEQRLDIHYRYRAAEDDQAHEPLHGEVEVIQHRYLYPWQLQDLCERAQGVLIGVYADFDEEVQLSEELRDDPWGIEFEHWVAQVKAHP